MPKKSTPRRLQYVSNSDKSHAFGLENHHTKRRHDILYYIIGTPIPSRTVLNWLRRPVADSLSGGIYNTLLMPLLTALKLVDLLSHSY